MFTALENLDAEVDTVLIQLGKVTNFMQLSPS
jgi:hypothetical protein